MPGRHTWYNQEYNKLLCDAGSLGDEPGATSCMTAERILVRTRPWCRSTIGSVAGQRDIVGPMLEPGERRPTDLEAVPLPVARDADLPGDDATQVAER